MLAHLGELADAGVAALKVEDAPRGAAYIRTLTAELRTTDRQVEAA
jgi:hypothetical protein